MASCEVKDASESEVTPPDEQTLDFDEDTLRAIAEVNKNEGNDEYRKKHFSDAVYFYTEGIKVGCKDKELNAKLYSNRATAHFYCGNYSDSLSDAKVATDLQPTYVKAIVRGASACVKLNLFEEAITWCDKGLATDKENTTLLELRKLSLNSKSTDKTDSSLETGAMDDKLSREEEFQNVARNTAPKKRTYCSLGAEAFNCGDFEACLEYFKLDLTEAKDAGDRKREGAACNNLGAAYYFLGNMQKAIQFYEQALSITKEVGNKSTEGVLYDNLGNAYYSLADFKKAVEFHEQALSIAKEIGNKSLEGEAYSSLGLAVCSLGDFKNAIKFHQHAISIAKKVGNKHSEGLAYMNLGSAYHVPGDFQTAITFHQQALDIAKEVKSRDQEGKAYGNLGSAYYSLGDFQKAIEFYQQLLIIAKEIGNKDTLALAYMNIGLAHGSLGDFKKAIAFQQQALSNAREVGNKNTEGKVYTNLGNAYHSLSDFQKAIEFHEHALSIAKEIGNKDTEGTVYTNLGIAYHSLSDFQKAIEFHQQAACIAKEVGNKVTEGNTYTNLGLAYYSLGDFKKAIEFQQEALTIATVVGNKDTKGHIYTNLGNAYKVLGDLKKSINFHQRALGIAKDVGNKDAEGHVCNNLGLAYRDLGDLEKAIEFHQQALSIAKEVGNKAIEVTVYCNLGLDYHDLGDLEKAVELHQQALSIAKDIGDKGAEGSVKGYLGRVYYSLGDLEKDIEFQQQALSIAKEVGNKAEEGEANGNLGIAYCSMGDFCRAEDFFKSSVRLCDEIRNLLQSNDEWKIGLRDRYYKAYRYLWGVQLQQHKTIEALCTAERARAQALMDLMESQYGVKSARPVSEEQMDTMSTISSHIPSLTIFIAEHRETVNFWVLQKGQQSQFIQTQTNDNNDSLESLTQKTYKQIGVFKRAMCENRSLDEPEDETSEELPDRGPGEKGLASSENEGGALKALSDVVIGPISHVLQGDELIIVPDGQLLLVPYAALLDQHSSYLSETLRIRLVPSLTSLKLMAECPEGFHSTSGALLVGDPWVETVRVKGTRFKQLPGARKEVEMIGAILKIDPLTGKNATKAEVLSKLNSVALVHIAAHGRAETGEIVLSPNDASSKRPKQEGFLLTMADVLNAKLRARLVVLSCCHSGRGKIKAEGVVGIARAFLGAGARSVLASLWAINDEATMQFMKHFYEHLMEGQSASTSLNQAMKWMRESDDFSDVKYWAPFVLIGDDVALSFGQSSIVSDQ